VRSVAPSCGSATAATLDIEPQVLVTTPRRRVLAVRRPLGPTAAIAPFNFPVTSGWPRSQRACAQATPSCSSPSPYTPLSTLRIGEIVRDIVPAGVLNIVSGDDGLGPIDDHASVGKVITFTGSTGVGRLIAAAALPISNGSPWRWVATTGDRARRRRR